MDKEFDVVVIGSGPGGYVAAIRSAQLGFKTACIEKYSTLGGTCLNVGCIPSKALLQSSENFEFIKKQSHDHGLEYKDLTFNFDIMMKRKDVIVNGLTKGIKQLFAKNKIEEIHGIASFNDPYTIEVNGKLIKSKNFIIATGSKPTELPFLPFDGTMIISSTEALSLKKIPKKMIVIGAGVIGLELASVYHRLGSEVTILEMQDVVCPTMDLDISKALHQIYQKQGINFYLSAKVTSAKKEKGSCQVNFTHENKEKIENAEIVLVAIGRRPYTQELQLSKIGINTDKQGFISVKPNFSTQYSHIFAIGDCINGPMLAHKASEEGALVAELISGEKKSLNYITIPNVIYTHPEVASVGFTEQEVKHLNREPLTGVFYFRGNPRARCSGDIEGFVKIIGDKATSKLLGVHIIGPHASELIGEGVIALKKQMTLEELADASHAHPTLSEAIKDAALSALKRPIHG